MLNTYMVNAAKMGNNQNKKKLIGWSLSPDRSVLPPWGISPSMAMGRAGPLPPMPRAPKPLAPSSSRAQNTQTKHAPPGRDSSPSACDPSWPSPGLRPGGF